MSFLFYGKLYFLHHLRTALSLTLFCLPISQNEYCLSSCFNSLLEIGGIEVFNLFAQLLQCFACLSFLFPHIGHRLLTAECGVEYFEICSGYLYLEFFHALPTLMSVIVHIPTLNFVAISACVKSLLSYSSNSCCISFTSSNVKTQG